MKLDNPLTKEQQTLVEKNLSLVYWVIIQDTLAPQPAVCHGSHGFPVLFMGVHIGHCF